MKTSPGSRHLVSFLFPILLILAVVLGRQWYFTPNTSNGEAAKDFSATTIDGQPFSLADTRGEVVLLQFWGSWCGPCRVKHPGLVNLKRELGDQLRIISVGIEQKEQNWRAAIVKDGLFWSDHILDKSSSTKFLNGPISDLYGVNEVPTSFLIDQEGKVVATNPSFNIIRQFVADAG